MNCKLIIEAPIICLIQYFEADFLWEVSLKILNSGIVLKAFTHVCILISWLLLRSQLIWIYTDLKTKNFQVKHGKSTFSNNYGQ